MSESLLNRAKEKAREQNIDIDLQRKDARKLRFKAEFDLVTMLCEGAFPLMETDEMNYRILKNASRSLTPKGKLIFTTLNGLFPLFHSVKEFINSDFEKNSSKNRATENTFDLMTFRDHSIYETEDDQGKKIKLDCNERYHVPSEITWLLKTLGFNSSFGVQNQEDCDDNRLNAQDICREVRRKVE